MIQRKMQFGILLGILILLGPNGKSRVISSAEKTNQPRSLNFSVHVINAESAFEAASIFDVNRDGKPDIFCGGFWYEGPTWKKHFVREIPEIDQYFLDFANLPLDVNGDGWTDVITAAWHNQTVAWIRNPGHGDGKFEVFDIDKPGNMETAILTDVNGDGTPDVLPNIMDRAAWYEFSKDLSSSLGIQWIKHGLPSDVAGHGIGAGDLNGDDRCDIVGPKGWLEQPARSDGTWLWHPEFELGTASVSILVHDVDGDGDADLIWGLGHGYGIYWLEQGRDSKGQRIWNKHLIDKDWSQAHFFLLADLDNDGQKEVVTGKRYRAHNGRDPGENDPLCIYYYRFDRIQKQWSRHVIHESGRVGFGINTMAADLDGDGDIDIVAPGKSGLYWLENHLK